MPIPPLTWLALRAIALYQRHLSPRKGYRCALHALGGGRSCSAYACRAIARSGVARGLVLLRRRLAACASVNHAFRRSTPPRYPAGTAYQRGFCGVTCDGFDCSGMDGCTGLMDGVSCFNCPPGDCGASWNNRRFCKPDKEDYLNNENALRSRIRQAQARARHDAQDGSGNS